MFAAYLSSSSIDSWKQKCPKYHWTDDDDASEPYVGNREESENT